MNIKDKNIKNRLKKLKREIDVLEYKLNHPKKTKIKSFIIKNLKISTKMVEFVAPYVLCASILTTLSPVVGLGLPMKSNDDIRVHANFVTEYRSYGDIITHKEYQYLDNSDEDNLIKFYSKWSKEGDYYTREVKAYKLKKITEEEILKLIDKENLDLLDIVDDIKYIEEEKRNDLSEEELKRNDFFEFLVYGKDKNDIIYRKETNEENIIITILYYSLVLAFGAATDYARRKIFGFNYANSIAKINKEYHSIYNEADIRQKIKIKKDNYNRLIK